MQMLAFARQTFLLVSAAVMPFWVSLLQHSAPRATEAPRHSPLPDDAAAALLELAGASQELLFADRNHAKDRLQFGSAASPHAVSSAGG